MFSGGEKVKSTWDRSGSGRALLYCIVWLIVTLELTSELIYGVTGFIYTPAEKITAVTKV